MEEPEEDGLNTYRRRDKNYLFKSNWREFKLPPALSEVMQREKRPAIENRFSAFPTGQSPFFMFKDSLFPKKDWHETLRRILQV